nr:putative reverse transcriptase domain-containing protein [Tanacetum cinerariifolium]
MSNFVLCVGCGEPLYDFSPCRWCTCEQCGIDLRHGFCPLCNSRNSCVYDPNPNSFDCPPDSYHPPHPTYETYSGDSCGIDSHLGYDCPPQFSLNHEPEPSYIQNYNSYPHDSPSFLQQCLYCDDYGGLHETFQCQPMNQNFYNSNSLGFDQSQTPQFPVIHPPPQETSIEILHDHTNVINSLQTFLRKFNRYSFFEMPKVLLLAWDRVFEIKDALGNKQYKPKDTQELFRELSNDVQNIHEELAEYINTSGWNRPAFYDDDDDDDVDYIIAITPVLSTEEPIDSLSMGDEHLDTILATKSDEVIKSSVDDLVPILSESEGILEHMCDAPFHDNSPPLNVSKDQFEDFSKSNDEFSSTDNDSFSIDNIDYVEASPPDSELVSSEVMEIVIPEVGRIDDDIPLTIKNDILREKLLNVNLFITKIEAFNDNLTLSSDCKTKSSSTSPNSFLEETNTFHNSFPEFENFYFDLGEISSGSTTTHSDISLPDYEAFSFNDDHIKEISSGSTTTHSDISLSEYDSFIFDLTHKEFVDELTHIISLPEYDCFYFRNLPDPGELMFMLNSKIRENLPSATSVNLLIDDDYFPLLAYVVWIFLAYLTYPVIPPYLHPFRNEDTIFDPGITINHFYSFKPCLSHRCGAFKKFNTHRSHLNEWPMTINGKNIPILDVLLRQKSYADVRRKTLEFNVGDKVMLKVSQWKGVIRFGKRRKLSLRYIGPFKILERIGPVAYKLELPRELQGIHDTFHVSNLKKCLSDESLIISLDEVQLDDKLHFIKEPVEIMDREVKKLKQSRIPIIKVRWNSRQGPEYTWKREDQMKSKYPHLFTSNLRTNQSNRAPGRRSRKARRM